MSRRDAPPASAPTFLAAPLVRLDAIRPGSVVIGGAPHDSTHFSRFGADGPAVASGRDRSRSRKLTNAADDGLVNVETDGALGARAPGVPPGRRGRLQCLSLGRECGRPRGSPGVRLRWCERVLRVLGVPRRGDRYDGYPSCLWLPAGRSGAAADRARQVHPIDGHLDFSDEVAALVRCDLRDQCPPDLRDRTYGRQPAAWSGSASRGG